MGEQCYLECKKDKEHNECYDKYKKLVTSVYYRSFGSHGPLSDDEMDDLYHDVLVKVHSAMEPTRDGRSKLSAPYLTKVTRSVVLDRVKHNMVKSEAHQTIQRGLLEEQERRSDYMFQCRLVQQLIAFLPEAMRPIASLKMEGYSNDVIAEKLGISRRTLQQLWNDIDDIIKAKVN